MIFTLVSLLLFLQCSIDSLLERTIKHMLFLQSVTKHADKLKHSGESKVSIIWLLLCIFFHLFIFWVGYYGFSSDTMHLVRIIK